MDEHFAGIEWHPSRSHVSLHRDRAAPKHHWMTASSWSHDYDVRQLVEAEDAALDAITSADGPFPLRREVVPHWGTTQHYMVWSKEGGKHNQVLDSMVDLWRFAEDKFHDRTFLVLDGMEYLTYGAVVSNARHLAAELSAHGLTSKSTVALAGRNTPEWCTAFIAVGFLGAVVLPLNGWLTDDDLRYCLDDSEADLIIIDGERLERTSLDVSHLRVICMNQGNHAVGQVTTLTEAVRQGRSRPPLGWPVVEQDAPAMLMYTSGTTSRPKGVVLTQRAVMSAVNMLRAMEHDPTKPDPGDRPQKTQIVPVPLFHINGTHNMLLSGAAAGRKLILMTKWSATEALRLIEKYRVQVLMGVPTMTYEILHHKDFEKTDLSSLETIGGGGAPFAAPMVAQVKQRFRNAKAKTGYGLTETSSTVSMFGGDLFGLVPGSVGRLARNIEGCVLDPENNKLPHGSVGEICVHGAIVMSHYLNQPRKTAEAFHMDSDGKLWFRTGDIGRIQPQGFLYIMDRAKDMVIRGGENISCSEVENCLYECGDVSECAVFGIPDPRLGETVAAVVILKEKEVDVLVEYTTNDGNLREHAESKLARFKVPKRILRWPGASLPRGATGKVLKKVIKERVVELLTRERTSGARLGAGEQFMVAAAAGTVPSARSKL